jgi:hypothetical protein
MTPRTNRNGNYQSDTLRRFLREFYFRSGVLENTPNDLVREASTKCWEDVIKHSMNPVFGGFVDDDIKWKKIK